MGAAALLILTPSARSETQGMDGLYRIDRLPAFRDSVSVASISSYDRTGGNDDGSSGAYSFVRKEGDGLVLAELEGPGVVTRIWTPTPTDDPLELYFDGETEPRLRLPLRKLFAGTHEPFVAPLASGGAGGNTSYVPIPYGDSLKIVLRAASFQFYRINYATYSEGTAIESWSRGYAERQREDLERARALWDPDALAIGIDFVSIVLERLR